MTKASVTLEPVTDDQQRQLKQVLESAAAQAVPVLLKRIPGITKPTLQKALNQGGKIKAATLTILVDSLADTVRNLAGLAPPDPRYRFVKEIGIIVPKNYQHNTHLNTFRKKHRNKFDYYHDALTDENFSPTATTKLLPGQHLKVAIFDIVQGVTVTSEDNLKFIRSQNGILTGAHGVSVVWEQHRRELPKGRWYDSFDEKDVLWEDADGSHRVPSVDAHSDGDFLFSLGYFEDEGYDSYSLLVFRDESLGA